MIIVRYNKMDQVICSLIPKKYLCHPGKDLKTGRKENMSQKETT